MTIKEKIKKLKSESLILGERLHALVKLEDGTYISAVKKQQMVDDEITKLESKLNF